MPITILAKVRSFIHKASQCKNFAEKLFTVLQRTPKGSKLSRGENDKNRKQGRRKTRERQRGRRNISQILNDSELIKCYRIDRARIMFAVDPIRNAFASQLCSLPIQ